MFQFSKYPLDILDMLSGHQAHQFKGLGLERQLQHQQQVQLQHQQQLQQQHQQQGESSGALLSGLGLGSLQGSRSNAFADSSSIFAKMSAPPPPISHQSQSSSSHSSRKSSKMSSSGSGSSAAGYPQFLRPFHPAEAALAQEQLHSGMGRFDFGGSSSGGSGVIGGVVTSAPPPPPLHPGLSVPQASPGPSSSPSPSASSSTSNNPGSAVSSLGQPLVGQSDPRSLHQQFSCMLAANQYFLSGVPTNSSLEQFLVQQGGHNHLGLGLGQGASDSNSALAPPPALHSSHSHSHSTPQPQQQQQPLAPHALSHPHSHTHPHHPLHPTPQPSSLGGFDFQGIPVLSSNQLASLMQQEASGMPLPLPLHLSLSKDEGKGDSGSGSGGSGGSRRKKAMAGYLPQRKADGTSHSSSSGSNCHSSSTEHSQNSIIQPGLVGGAITSLGNNHSSVLSSSTQSSSTVSSSSSSAPSSSTASVLVANDSQLPKPANPMASMPCQPDPEAIYHCGECGKTFSHLTSLRRHLRSHGLTSEDAKPDTSSEDKTFCCTECGKGFKKRGHLLQHGVIHSGARPFACGVCQRSFNRRESLTRHEKIHDDKPFRCPACGRCFRESTSLLNHAASGTCGKPGRNSRPRPSGSGENQSSSSASNSKTEMVAGGSGTGDYQRDGASKYGTDYSRNRPSYQPSYSVDDYRRQQANQSNQSCYSGESSHSSEMSSQTLRKAPLAPTLHPHPQSQQQQQQHHLHQQQPHLPLSSLLDDSEDEVTSSAMSAIAAAAAASCEISTGESRGEERRDIIGGLLGGLGFGNMGVSPGGPSSTSEIDKTYRAGSGSTMPLTHPSQQMMNAKPKKPRKPRQKREPGPDGIIVRQRRSRGEGERPYSCGVCGKGFRRRETLRRHDRVHTGEKPHRCDVCGKEFREYFHLTKHSTVHSGQKNYKCDLCGKEFAYAQSLVRHGKLHTKGELDGTPGGKIAKGHGGVNNLDGNQANSQSYYPYPQDKSQGSSSSTQPSQKLYTCTTCWKSFRHQFHLTAHQQTVHGGGIRGEKNFCCEVCGKAFAYSNSLSRHRQSQHGLGRTGSANPPAGGTQHPSQAAEYIPLFESGHPSAYLSGSYMPNQSSQGQHRPFQFQSQEGWVGGKRKREKKRRVEYQSIMRGGQLVGVALNKATSRRLKVMKRKKGIMHEKLKQKKLLAQLLRMRGGYRVKQWCGGVVKVSGLSSMEVPIKRFPCQYCPSTTFASQAKLLIHRSVRHPPRNNGHQARLKCSVCGKRSRTLRKALIHRGRHLSQGRFSCPKCRSRFWNGSLLERHRVACRGQSLLGSGNWGLNVNLPPREVVEKTAEEAVQEGQPGRTTVVTEYSH